MPPRHLVCILLLALAPIACSSSSSSPKHKKPEPETPLEMPDFDAHDWPDALRLNNGAVNLILAPSVGRVLRFGYPDAPNVLWTNPNHRPPRLGEDIKDKPVDLADPASQLKWKNYGGDKAWPWPQDQWPQYIGRTWPPPLEVDAKPQRARLNGALGVRMESETIRGYGVRQVRDITLDARGEPRATFVTRFERASEDLPPVELAAWQITQLPFGGTVYAKMALGGKVTGLDPAPWTEHHEIGPGIIVLDPPPIAPAKTGLDADALAWAADELLFVARSQTASYESSKFRAGERAQVFVQAAPNPSKASENTPTRYIEFEFTSPRRDLARNQVPELRVTWELYRIEGGTWTDANVVAVLGGAVLRPAPDDNPKR
jgi:hypothetical protein